MASSERSWVESANDPSADFSLANLPYGVFSRSGTQDPPRVGVAVGDSIVDVTAAVNAGLISKSNATAACASATLNSLMAAASSERRNLRDAVSDLLRGGSSTGKKAQPLRGDFLFPISQSTLYLPVAIGDYTVGSPGTELEFAL